MTADALRVLHVVPYFPPDRMGGVGEVVAHLHRGLLAEGHDSVVLTGGTSHQDPRVIRIASTPTGFVLGCGRLRPYSDFCELASLAVSSHVRAGGLGREIVNSLLERYSGPIYLICENGVVDFFRRFGFASILDREMPAGLGPKWDYFAGLAGPMNLMLRGENLHAGCRPDDPGCAG